MNSRPLVATALLFVIGTVLAAACGDDVTASAPGTGGATATTSSTSNEGGSGAVGAVGGAGGVGAQGGVAAGGEAQGGAGTAGAGGGLVFCNPAPVLCDAMPPNCDPGEVPSVVGTCWGSCVPILSCAPDESCEGCAGWCATYQAWTTEYRCVAPSIECAAMSCECLGPYFCVDPFSACSIDGNDVVCGCPAC